MMNHETTRVFLPSRRQGGFLHIGILLIEISASAGLFITAFLQTQRVLFIIFLLAGLALLLPMPLIIYRLAALLRARYEINRDGLKVRWGAAQEDIPLDTVEWVRPYSSTRTPEGLPFFSVPGAILGSRQNTTFGKIEYFASDKANLLLIGLGDRALAVSPSDMTGFLSEFQRCLELGSLRALPARSARVDVVFSSAWSDRQMRLLILTALVLSIVLLAATAFMIPTRESVALGISSPGQPFELAPSDRLLLLPVLSLIFFVIDTSIGVYLRRDPARQKAANFILASASILPILFLLLLARIMLMR